MRGMERGCTQVVRKGRTEGGCETMFRIVSFELAEEVVVVWIIILCRHVVCHQVALSLLRSGVGRIVVDSWWKANCSHHQTLSSSSRMDF